MKRSSRIDLDSAHWRKSSYSNAEGADCIEVADDFPGLVPVRDSKDPDGAALLFPAGAWNSFITAVVSATLSCRAVQ
ncbi:DUF397 domain-containing protein [Streptomyces inhibens]|uniref:DUF397 domain-containing protein n=1 Tax=Streptomyces inhibens TaxID=2293571 RepID=UPI001EE6BDCF|nr:DUF397 domain-containing protein [Streptomyces inhibens]UKY51055.1 DUF397 domain-containing protein [Streptomyces inhibens]